LADDRRVVGEDIPWGHPWVWDNGRRISNGQEWHENHSDGHDEPVWNEPFGRNLIEKFM